MYDIDVINDVEYQKFTVKQMFVLSCNVPQIFLCDVISRTSSVNVCLLPPPPQDSKGSRTNAPGGLGIRTTLPPKGPHTPPPQEFVKNYM